MKNYLDVLKDCSLFKNIEPELLNKMLVCLGVKVDFFDKKYTIMSEGSPAKYIGIVLSGSAQITQLDYYGNRSIISNVQRADVFAEAFACAELNNMPVSVIASAPSEIMFIDCGHILHTCSNNCEFHQQLIFNLMKGLATKALVFHQKIDIVSKRTTRDKLMAYLMLQAKMANSNSFDIVFDRQELADYLQVDRSGLSAEISKLRNEKVLLCNKNRFTLL